MRQPKPALSPSSQRATGPSPGVKLPPGRDLSRLIAQPKSPSLNGIAIGRQGIPHCQLCDVLPCWPIPGLFDDPLGELPVHSPRHRIVQGSDVCRGLRDRADAYHRIGTAGMGASAIDPYG